MSVAEVVFWVAVCTLSYVCIGYPLILILAGSLHTQRMDAGAVLPRVSLIISAYNEEKVIGEKLQNSLALEYPRDRLEIVVVSDASSDRTDAIVEGYAPEGVRLQRMPTRGGKTAGLNAVVPIIQGEIIVFSDANAFYAPDAIQKLVRNFLDPSVGCVAGDSRYTKLEASYVGESENTYWSYERLLKVKESALGSMVGADGAIFAIRKHLYSPLKAEDINDFVLPLQIVAQGYRCIFEPEAICYENAVVHFAEEFRRKIRVVNRSWHGMFRVKELLNPFRYGWFSVQLISHKLLRWLIPVFLMSLLLSSVFLASKHWMYAGLAAGQLSFYALGMLGLALERWQIHSGWLAFPGYFFLMNVASVIGGLKYVRGERINIWEPERAGRYRPRERYVLARWAGLLLACGLLLTTAIQWPEPAFWVAFSLMIYTYIGYLALCMLLGGLLARPWSKGDLQPTVTLLIVAHNEEEILKTKLDNSLALDYPQDKLVIAVVSDGSTDNTNAILRHYEGSGVRTYYTPQQAGKMAAINRLLPELWTEIVILSDANVIYAQDALKKLVRNFADESVGAVSGRVTLVGNQPLPAVPERLYYRYEWLIQQLESQTGSLVGVDGAMYGIRRELFQPLADDVVLDDFVIAMNIAKQGKRVVYEPEARGHEASAASFEVELQRRIRLAAGAVQSVLRGEGLPRLTQPLLLFRYLSHKVFRWCTPVFMAITLLANFSLLDKHFYLLIFAGQMLFYSTALVGKFQRSPTWIFAVPLYFCGVNAAAAFGLVHGILHQQKGAWKKLGRASLPM
jgi:cellulose synthase/poly-beta-1,6-N-acetylglucosamine synthase-like glycosyltransferase